MALAERVGVAFRRGPESESEVQTLVPAHPDRPASSDHQAKHGDHHHVFTELPRHSVFHVFVARSRPRVENFPIDDNRFISLQRVAT